MISGGHDRNDDDYHHYHDDGRYPALAFPIAHFNEIKRFGFFGLYSIVLFSRSGTASQKCVSRAEN